MKNGIWSTPIVAVLHRAVIRMDQWLWNKRYARKS